MFDTCRAVCRCENRARASCAVCIVEAAEILSGLCFHAVVKLIDVLGFSGLDHILDFLHVTKFWSMIKLR